MLLGQEQQKMALVSLTTSLLVIFFVSKEMYGCSAKYLLALDWMRDQSIKD